MKDRISNQLAGAREGVLANLTDPWRAVELFEPILEELRLRDLDLDLREERLARIRELGRDLFAELSAQAEPVAMEVRHYCWHLQHLGDPLASPASSVKDLFMVTLTRFAHYQGHLVHQCQICTEFPDDLPFQFGTGGREDFNEWLKRQSAGRDTCRGKVTDLARRDVLALESTFMLGGQVR